MTKKKPSEAKAPMNLTIDMLPEGSRERAIAETIRTVARTEGWSTNVASNHVRSFLANDRKVEKIDGMTWSRAVAAARGSLEATPEEQIKTP